MRPWIAVLFLILVGCEDSQAYHHFRVRCEARGGYVSSDERTICYRKEVLGVYPDTALRP